MLSKPWQAASRHAPCPICGRGKSIDERCYFIPGNVAVCYRMENHATLPKKRGTWQMPKGGWLHVLSAGGGGSVARAASTSTLSAEQKPAPKRNDLHILARKFSTAMSPARLNVLSRELGLSADSLQRLDVGWCDGEQMYSPRRDCMVRVYAWSFPMRDGAAVTGLRMRSRDPDPRTGKVAKFSFTGGGGGLHVPAGLTADRVFLCEGPTDTAAALDLGLNTFGRTSCESEVQLVNAMLKLWRFPELVIFSQRDEWKPYDKRRPELGGFYPAQRGAEAMAKVARLYCPHVRVIMPPADVGKDVRDWLRAGATYGDVEQLVAAADDRRLKVISLPNNKTTTSREGVRL